MIDYKKSIFILLLSLIIFNQSLCAFGKPNVIYVQRSSSYLPSFKNIALTGCVCAAGFCLFDYIFNDGKQTRRLVKKSTKKLKREIRNVGTKVDDFRQWSQQKFRDMLSKISHVQETQEEMRQENRQQHERTQANQDQMREENLNEHQRTREQMRNLRQEMNRLNRKFTNSTFAAANGSTEESSKTPFYSRFTQHFNW